MGALLFEMLTGLPPYYSKDTNEMYQRIINEELSFPDFINKNHPVVDLLIKLLTKDPRNRIKTA
jgi:serum/glucocorticoid-regulated kinase 2